MLFIIPVAAVAELLVVVRRSAVHRVPDVRFHRDGLVVFVYHHGHQIFNIIRRHHRKF